MSSLTVAQALAYINWTVLMALAAGSLGLALGLRWTTDATRGYLSFSAGFAAVLGALVWLTDTGLPPPSGLAIVDAPPIIDTIRQAALLAFVVASAATAVVLRRGGRAAVMGPAGVVAAVVAFGAAAFGWSADATTAIPLLVQYATLSVVTGVALGSVVLSHWYLVTPRLGERPLIVTTRVLSVAVALQLALFATWAAFGTGSAAGAAPFAVLTGSAALFVWLRLIVSLVGPLVLSVMAERTARTRSMESATGLLYIDLAAIAAGTIVAAALAYTGGILV